MKIKNKIMEKVEKYGFIEQDGSYLVEPRFERAESFSEGLAVVIENGKYGFIYRTGKIVIEPKYIWASSFENGVARVRDENKDCYINIKGEIISEEEADSTSGFYKGGLSKALGAVISRQAYMLPNGDMIVEPASSDFSEGLGKYEHQTNHMLDYKFGFMDEEKKIVIAAQFDEVEDFSEGFAAVCYEGKWCFVDKQGEFVFDKTFDECWGFHEGLAKVKVDGLIGYIDTKGNYVIHPQYYVGSNFSDGLAFVQKNKNEDLGYIDMENNMVIPPKYNCLGIFKEGRAFAGKDKRYGLINKKGEYLIEPKFRHAEPFQEGFAVVSLEK